MKERDISLKDLFFEFLLHWRIFIIVMLISSMLMGVSSYINSIVEVKAAAEKRQMAESARLKKTINIPEDGELEWVLKKLDSAQQQYVEYAAAYAEMLQDSIEYQKQSVYMQIDSNRVFRAAIIFHISSETREKSSSIERVYEETARYGGISEFIAGKLDMEPQYASELITVQNSSETYGTEQDSFVLNIIHYNRELCIEMANAAVQFIMGRRNEMENVFGEHKITAFAPVVSVISDGKIKNSQKTFWDNFAKLQENIKNANEKFSVYQWIYYDILVNGEVTETSLKNVNKLINNEDGGDELDYELPEVGVHWSYVVLGALLAAFVYGFVILIRYIFDPRVRRTDNFQLLYDIPQLGFVPEKQGQKGRFGFVDKWLVSLRDKNECKLPEDDNIILISTAIRLLLGKHSINEIGLVGCCLKGRGLDVCEKIRGILTAGGVQVTILDNVLYDVEAMEKLGNVSEVVLVGKVGTTSYKDISQEIEMLQRQDIQILGSVIVE